MLSWSRILTGEPRPCNASVKPAPSRSTTTMRRSVLFLMGVAACSGSDKAGDTATNAPPSAPVVALDAADSTQDLTVRIIEPLSLIHI